MTPERDKNARITIEALLDGVLSESEMRAVVESVGEHDCEVARAEQSRIDDSMRRLFEPGRISHDQLTAWLDRKPFDAGAVDREIPGLDSASPLVSSHTDGARSQSSESFWRMDRKKVAVMLAVAALVAWTIVAFQFRGNDRNEPLFVARPLVLIYQEAVAQGFEPYYECREPDRFAYTFQQRQGIPIDLAQMPNGSGMLGLSYSGGLSRDTTVMLCRVDGVPVMVFVDRVGNDRKASDIVASSDELNVYRDERDGLVMYEVTPLEFPSAMGFLRPRKE